MKSVFALILMGTLSAYAGLDSESHNWGWGNCTSGAQLCVEVKINCEGVSEPVATALKPFDRDMGVLIRTDREITDYWYPYDERPSVMEPIHFRPGFAVGKGGYEIYLENKSVIIVHPHGALINLGEITLQGLRCGEPYNGHDSVAVKMIPNPEVSFVIRGSSERQLVIQAGAERPIVLPEWK